MIFIAIRAARDAFAIICVECGAGECGASFHAVFISRIFDVVVAAEIYLQFHLEIDIRIHIQMLKAYPCLLLPSRAPFIPLML